MVSKIFKKGLCALGEMLSNQRTMSDDGFAPEAMVKDIKIVNNETNIDKLLEISSPVFSVSTTYLMPIVAIFWGLLDGEEFKLVQVLGTGVILIGVYLVTKKKGA